MPSPPYAKVQVSVNGGGVQVGAITVLHGDTIQLVPESTVGWTSQRWEIFDYPTGWTVPAGWTDDGAGTYYALTIVPPSFVFPASTALWGKMLFRLLVNQALTGDDADEQLTDEVTTAVQAFSPNFGFPDMGAGETIQFDQVRQWVGAYKAVLRLIDNIIAGSGGPPSGAAGGNLIDTYPNPRVAKVNDASIPRAGSLVTGNAPYVSGPSALTYSALHLDGGVGWVTGVLPDANLPVVAVDTIPDLIALDTTGYSDAREVMVRELFQTFLLVRGNSDTPNNISIVAAKQGAGTNGNWLREAA